MSFLPVNAIVFANAINVAASCWMTLKVPSLLARQCSFPNHFRKLTSNKLPFTNKNFGGVTLKLKFEGGGDDCKSGAF
jgi:hypothetical protein